MKNRILEVGQRQTEARRNSRRRRRYRRLIRNWSSLLAVLFLVVFVGAFVGPPIYRAARDRIQRATLPIRLRAETLERYRERRPVADAYRNEALINGTDGYLLRGDCLIDGKWHRYWIKEQQEIVVPLDEESH